VTSKKFGGLLADSRPYPASYQSWQKDEADYPLDEEEVQVQLDNLMQTDFLWH